MLLLRPMDLLLLMGLDLELSLLLLGMELFVHDLDQ